MYMESDPNLGILALPLALPHVPLLYVMLVHKYLWKAVGRRVLWSKGKEKKKKGKEKSKETVKKDYQNQKLNHKTTNKFRNKFESQELMNG